MNEILSHEASKKIFAYENYEGDKGIIIADTELEARGLFLERYPDRKIVNNDHEFWNNGAYLFEFSNLEDKSALYCTFEW